MYFLYIFEKFCDCTKIDARSTESGYDSTVPSLFTTLAIKAATRPLDSNHGPGSKHTGVACLFHSESTARSYKKSTVERRTSPTLSGTVRRPFRLYPRRHNRHIPVTSLPAHDIQCPAPTISPICKKKSSSKPSKPSCQLNNILNRRRNRLIAMPTCGGSYFRAVRGSTKSTSGDNIRCTQSGVVTIMRFDCLG